MLNWNNASVQASSCMCWDLVLVTRSKYLQSRLHCAVDQFLLVQLEYSLREGKKFLVCLFFCISLLHMTVHLQRIHSICFLSYFFRMKFMVLFTRTLLFRFTYSHIYDLDLRMFSFRAYLRETKFKDKKFETKSSWLLLRVEKFCKQQFIPSILQSWQTPMHTISIALGVCQLLFGWRAPQLFVNLCVCILPIT